MRRHKVRTHCVCGDVVGYDAVLLAGVCAGNLRRRALRTRRHDLDRRANTEPVGG